MALNPTGRQYTNMVVKLPDLTVTEDVLQNLTFENCEIIGPAVVMVLGSTVVSNCTWEADPASLFWVIPDEQDAVTGAIGLLDCSFFGCRFRRVGLGVPAVNLEIVKQGFGLS